jgi:CRISPR-associated protein Csm5
MKQTYPLQLTTLTPVCIGTGNKLSPYADYVIDEQRKKIYYIDQELVKNKLAKEPNLIDEYVEGVANGMDNNRSSFNLKNFLKNRLNIDVHKEHRLQLDCEAKGSKELYTIVKNAGLQPYVPGSSLKGAVKTALLYDWLVNEAGGKKAVESLLKNSRDENANEVIEKAFNGFKLGFSDSSLIDANRMMCIDNKRLHIKKGNTAIPQAWESILAGTQASLSFSEREGNNYQQLSWKELCRVLNQYAKAGNQCEWDILTDTAGEEMTDDVYNRLYDFYEKINKDINEAKDNTAFLKLGSGKGYYLNSVGLALFDADKSEDKTSFLKFLKQSGFGKVYKKETRKMEDYDLNPYDFPVTRVIDVHKIQPVGWVKLEIEK